MCVSRSCRNDLQVLQVLQALQALQALLACSLSLHSVGRKAGKDERCTSKYGSRMQIIKGFDCVWVVLQWFFRRGDDLKFFVGKLLKVEANFKWTNWSSSISQRLPNHVRIVKTWFLSSVCSIVKERILMGSMWFENSMGIIQSRIAIEFLPPPM